MVLPNGKSCRGSPTDSVQYLELQPWLPRRWIGLSHIEKSNRGLHLRTDLSNRPFKQRQSSFAVQFVLFLIRLRCPHVSSGQHGETKFRKRPGHFHMRRPRSLGVAIHRRNRNSFVRSARFQICKIDEKSQATPGGFSPTRMVVSLIR